MDKINQMLKRLEDIGKSLENTGEAKALLGLGSIGKESERFDKYSDLDFFVIVKNGKKRRFIDNLDWLTNISEAGYYYLNSPDGYKLLYKDGIYCEFAVFEESELKNIPYSEGKIIWKENDFDESLCIPKNKNSPWKPDNLEWAFNEAITCIYVGLCRYKRGEKLSGTKFVQSFAVDILIASSSYFSEEKKDFKDEFQHERRYENRYPDIAKYLPLMIQGYEKTADSALEILKFIETKYNVNQYIKQRILELITDIKQEAI